MDFQSSTRHLLIKILSQLTILGQVADQLKQVLDSSEFGKSKVIGSIQHDSDGRNDP